MNSEVRIPITHPQATKKNTLSNNLNEIYKSWKNLPINPIDRITNKNNKKKSHIAHTSIFQSDEKKK